MFDVTCYCQKQTQLNYNHEKKDVYYGNKQIR